MRGWSRSPTPIPRPPKRSPSPPARRSQSVDEIIAANDIDAVLIGTPTDTHADLIERARQGRQGGVLREAGRSRRRRASSLPEGGREGRHAADDRLQPPLRSELRCAQEAARRRRHRRGRDGDASSRAIPAPPPISYIERSGGLYRDMMIHDLDMARFLLGEEPVEVHAIGSVAGRPGDRQGRRRRHRDGDA